MLNKKSLSFMKYLSVLVVFFYIFLEWELIIFFELMVRFEKIGKFLENLYIVFLE